MSLSLNIHHHSSCWKTTDKAETVLQGASRALWMTLEASEKEILPLADCEASFVLADDLFIQGLNKDYRAKDKATNVLSFPAHEGEIVADGLDEEPLELGDIILAFETIGQEARDAHISFEAHLSHMAVHGLLHLLGFDHIKEPEAKIMEDMERLILSSLGIDDPYD